MAAAAGVKSSAKDARELYEMKERAIRFYTDNGVPKKMEEILNSMFHDNPADVYGHLANYFAEFAKVPVITKVKGRQGYDSKGQSTVQTEVYCMVKNHEKLISSCVAPSVTSMLLDTAKPEEKDTEDAERQASVTAAINYINTDICNKLEGLDPTQQTEADDVVYNFIQQMKDEMEAQKAAEAAAAAAENAEEAPTQDTNESNNSKKAKSPTGKGAKGKASQIIIIPDEAREELLDGSCLVSALSQAVCTAGAAIKDVQLYHYIAALKHKEMPSTLQLPLPMVTIIQGGKGAAGKMNCIKEYMVIPKPGVPLRESMKNILGIYNHVSKALCVKGGGNARNVNDLGALCPVFDKPEQGLDLIQEAMTALSLTPGEDVSIALNIAAHEMFDFDKGKYEVVTGQLKTTEDYVEFLVELLGRYPAINAVIDPLRKQDREQWIRLCDRISVAGYIVGDYGYHRPGLLKHEELDEDYQTSGILLRWEQMNTLSDIIAVANKMEEAENEIFVTAGPGETSQDILADLAVGLNARFLKLGAPCRGERISKLNRLLQIEAELEEQGTLGFHDAHLYPRIELTPPPVATETEAEDSSPSPAKKGTKKK
ncbi:enolase 4-like isoform X2 [Haliotis rufescens]|uniref:enolase 4-like isoform X2 n=1 Tax=Haliotis rufescens TaxID=6454 RepID=UPI001EB01A53|nr:enolase 4-like isoform X2 [Haliotis rufescens]